jgi:hypothetical protein
MDFPLLSLGLFAALWAQHDFIDWRPEDFYYEFLLCSNISWAIQERRRWAGLVVQVQGPGPSCFSSGPKCGLGCEYALCGGTNTGPQTLGGLLQHPSYPALWLVAVKAELGFKRQVSNFSKY